MITVDGRLFDWQDNSGRVTILKLYEHCQLLKDAIAWPMQIAIRGEHTTMVFQRDFDSVTTEQSAVRYFSAADSGRLIAEVHLSLPYQ